MPETSANQLTIEHEANEKIAFGSLYVASAVIMPYIKQALERDYCYRGIPDAKVTIITIEGQQYLITMSGDSRSYLSLNESGPRCYHVLSVGKQCMRDKIISLHDSMLGSIDALAVSRPRLGLKRINSNNRTQELLEIILGI